MNGILITILTISCLSFCLEQYLNYRNVKCMSQEIPKEVSDIYDQKQYDNQQKYLITNTKFDFFQSLLILVLSLVLFGFCIYGEVYNYFFELTNNIFISDVLCLCVFELINTIITTLFNIYDTFVIENRFGFNKTTPKLFIKDTLISWCLSTILTIGIFSVIYWLYIQFGVWLILTAFVFTSLFSFIMAFFYSDIIVPLFNKQTLLEDGELKDMINEFAKKVGFDISNIYVIDSSKRTTKPNAYFTGFGKKKRIVLNDTLIETLNNDEIVAVIAHEIGHYKNKHILKSYISGSIITLLEFSLLTLILTYMNIGDVMGNSHFSLFITMLIFTVLEQPLSEGLHFISSHFTRKHEYDADNFAKDNGYGDYLISALKKLSKESLSNLTPDKWFVKFNYSHPTIVDRIRNIQK